MKERGDGPECNAQLANVVNSMVKDSLPEEKLQEKTSTYHRPENCESLTNVQVNQAVWEHLIPIIRSQDVKL